MYTWYLRPRDTDRVRVNVVAEDHATAYEAATATIKGVMLRDDGTANRTFLEVHCGENEWRVVKVNKLGKNEPLDVVTLKPLG